MRPLISPANLHPGLEHEMITSLMLTCKMLTWLPLACGGQSITQQHTEHLTNGVLVANMVSFMSTLTFCIIHGGLSACLPKDPVCFLTC